MPMFIYVCKNPTPHKTQVFIPASAMGSPSPGATGGNQGAIVPAGQAAGAQGVITCPKCAFTAQPADGSMSSVSNGLGGGGGAAGMQQEEAVAVAGVGQTDQGTQVAPLLANTPDSAVRLTSSGGGVGNVAATLGQGSGQYNLNQSGVKNLL